MENRVLLRKYGAIVPVGGNTCPLREVRHEENLKSHYRGAHRSGTDLRRGVGRGDHLARWGGDDGGVRSEQPERDGHRVRPLARPPRKYRGPRHCSVAAHKRSYETWLVRQQLWISDRPSSYRPRPAVP